MEGGKGGRQRRVEGEGDRGWEGKGTEEGGRERGQKWKREKENRWQNC